MAQGFAALLGNVGRFLAMGAAVAAFVAGIASTAPAWIQSVSTLTPIGPAIAGVRQLAADGSMSWGSVVLLLVWLGVGLLLALGGVSRHRREAVPSLPAAVELPVGDPEAVLVS